MDMREAQGPEDLMTHADTGVRRLGLGAAQQEARLCRKHWESARSPSPSLQKVPPRHFHSVFPYSQAQHLPLFD